MIRGNYYLSFYQAILDRDLTKLVQLHDLTNEEELNYPEEYTHLDANEIFKANHPMDFISSLFRTVKYQELYFKYYHANNPLATEENIALREKTSLELLKHPLIDYCPSDSSSIIENLLAMSYSKIITKEEIITKLTPLLNKSPIIDNILSVMAISTTINQVNPFSIALIDEKMESYDPVMGDCGGYHDSILNRIVVTNKDDKLNLEVIIHELAHKTMDEVFDNSCEPYNNESSEAKYHQVIKNTLLNIQQFIQQDFGLEIKFEDQNDTWKMGETLRTMLFPQYSADKGIQEFIYSLKKYNLNIDDKLSWLDGCRPLGVALGYLEFELADALVAAGATIPPTTLHSAAMYDNSEIMNWFLENQPTIDANHKNCEGLTALDYASDPQIIRTLISAGAIAYPPNFEPICDIDPKCQDTEEDSIIITEQLHALEILLRSYNQDNIQSYEDSEFIVILPQIIAGDLYKGKIIDMLEPQAEYWQEIVSPATKLYQEQHDTSKICLASFDYTDFF